MVPAPTPGSRGEGIDSTPSSSLSPGGGTGVGSGSGSGGGTEKQVDAKYPALMFKQSLAASVEKLFSVIRDSVKKDISSTLSACIQVCPRHPLGVLPEGLLAEDCLFCVAGKDEAVQGWYTFPAPTGDLVLFPLCWATCRGLRTMARFRVWRTWHSCCSHTLGPCLQSASHGRV